MRMTMSARKYLSILWSFFAKMDLMLNLEK